jgi:formylglycine-generating enzyme required for sulfatase activity
MTRFPCVLAALLLVAGICCGGVTATSGPAVEDASADVHVADSGADSEAQEVILPEVTPSGKDCPDTEVHNGRVCVPEGWFWMSRWTTARWSGTWDQESIPKVSHQPVYLNAYRLDEHEVTHAQYLDFVVATGSAPLPEKCGFRTTWGDDPKELWQNVESEVSGWAEGKPDPALVDHPVVCVTRQEASAYCAWRGGRLPTVAQWLSAGRGAYPDMRRFPWGEGPPEEDLYLPTWNGWNAFKTAYVPCDKNKQPGLHTAPAASPILGRSPRKVLGLAGNASEHLSTCFEDLESFYPLSGPLVRPEDPPKVQCSAAVLVGGTSWVSRISHYVQYVGSQTVFRMRGTAPPYESAWPPQYANDIKSDLRWVNHFWDEAGPDDPPAVVEPAGNDRRSWAIGFRCSYDLD